MKVISETNKYSKIITLDCLPIGKTAVVSSIQAEGATRRRLMDLGLIPGTRVKALHISPIGDPKAYLIRGAVIAFRKEEGLKIKVNYMED